MQNSPKSFRNYTPLSATQKGVYLYQLIYPHSYRYNIGVKFKLEFTGSFSSDAMHQALTTLINQNSALRIRLIEKDGDNDVLKSESKNSIDHIKNLTDNVNKKIEHSIESEFSQLQNELDILMQSELAQALINQESINYQFIIFIMT